jgi:hypothetical protein
MAKPPSPDEQDRARLSKEVLPHVQAFYSDYVDIDALRPHSVFNSRF